MQPMPLADQAGEKGFGAKSRSSLGALLRLLSRPSKPWYIKKDRPRQYGLSFESFENERYLFFVQKNVRAFQRSSTSAVLLA